MDLPLLQRAIASGNGDGSTTDNGFSPEKVLRGTAGSTDDSTTILQQAPGAATSGVPDKLTNTAEDGAGKVTDLTDTVSSPLP